MVEPDFLNEHTIRFTCPNSITKKKNHKEKKGTGTNGHSK